MPFWRIPSILSAYHFLDIGRGDFGGKLPFLGFRTIIRAEKIDYKQEKWATRQKIHKTQFRSILSDYNFLNIDFRAEPTFLGFKC